MSLTLVFVDTAVLVACYDPQASVRRPQAQAWLRRLWEGRQGRTSQQVLNEFYALARQTFRTALAAGDARQAVTAFTVAAQHLPGVAQVFNNLALAHEAIGDLPAAEKNLHTALELDGKYAEAWFNLANLLQSQGQAGPADEARAKALRLNPALGQVQGA